MQEGVCGQLMLFAPLIRPDNGLVGGCASPQIRSMVMICLLCKQSKKQKQYFQI